MDRRKALEVLTTAAMSAWASPVLGQGNVTRIVVPYAAGGQSDVIARALADSLQNTLNRTVLVDNRPGASGLIATKLVQSAPSDGNTMVLQTATFAASPLLLKAANYNAETDFEPVAMIGLGPSFLMITDSVPARTIPEFIAYARSVPDGIECANSGINTGGHISAMMLEKMTGIKLIHVPYKGSAEVTRALLSGDVKMQVSVTTDSLNPYIKSGKIRVLGVTSRERTALAPDVPVIGQFVPGYAADGWFGILAPPKTPLAAREALSVAIKRALEEPAVKERFIASVVEIDHQGPAEFARTIRRSIEHFKKISADLGLIPQ